MPGDFMKILSKSNAVLGGLVVMDHMPSSWTLSSKQSGNFRALIAAAAEAAAVSAAKLHFVVCG